MCTICGRLFSARSFCSVRLPTPPVDLCKSVQSVGECFGCVGSTLLQNRQAEDVLPQISQILTDGCVSSPTESTELTEVWVR